jgi:hypothetical protein
MWHSLLVSGVVPLRGGGALRFTKVVFRCATARNT